MATQARHIEAQVIDPTTKAGFDEIAASHGREAAHNARIAALKARVEAASGFRWHDRGPKRELESAMVDLIFEQRHPEQARILRELGKSW